MLEAELNTEITDDDDFDGMVADLGVDSGETDEDSVEEQPETDEPTGEGEDTDEEPKIKVGDKEYTPSQILEFEKGYMRQADYTKKTQDIAAARREIEQAMQKQVLDDFYNKPKPKVQPTPDGNKELTDEDLALMEPETRRVYEVAKATEARLAVIEAEAWERKRAEHDAYLTNTMDGFYKKLIDSGMDPTEADTTAAEVSRTVRTEKLPYSPKSFERVFNSNKTVDVEAIRKSAREEALAEYKRQKAEDATAGLAGASANDAPTVDIIPADLDRDDPDTLIRMMAQDIGRMD